MSSGFCRYSKNIFSNYNFAIWKSVTVALFNRFRRRAPCRCAGAAIKNQEENRLQCSLPVSILYYGNSELIGKVKQFSAPHKSFPDFLWYTCSFHKLSSS